MFVICQYTNPIAIVILSSKGNGPNVCFGPEVDSGPGVRCYLPLTKDFATSRAHSMKRSTTGLSIRFFNVRITTAHGSVGKPTGNFFNVRPSLPRNTELAMRSTT
jgi:hypothetical protein